MRSGTAPAEVVRQVQRTLCEILDVEADELREHVSLVEDLHVDSLLAIEIICALETAFDIDVGQEAIMEIETVGDLYRVSCEHLR